MSKPDPFHEHSVRTSSRNRLMQSWNNGFSDKGGGSKMDFALPRLARPRSRSTSRAKPNKKDDNKSKGKKDEKEEEEDEDGEIDLLGDLDDAWCWPGRAVEMKPKELREPETVILDAETARAHDSVELADLDNLEEDQADPETEDLIIRLGNLVMDSAPYHEFVAAETKRKCQEWKRRSEGNESPTLEEQTMIEQMIRGYIGEARMILTSRERREQERREQQRLEALEAAKTLHHAPPPRPNEGDVVMGVAEPEIKQTRTHPPLADAGSRLRQPLPSPALQKDKDGFAIPLSKTPAPTPSSLIQRWNQTQAESGLHTGASAPPSRPIPMVVPFANRPPPVSLPLNSPVRERERSKMPDLFSPTGK